MANQELYRKRARYYDLIYSYKDYKKESEEIMTLIGKHKKSKSNKLLDVACGTGKHIRYFKGRFVCTGVDASEEMLCIAKRNVPGVRFMCRDMARLNLNEKFDVITCLFSSIGYVTAKDGLEETMRRFAQHLMPGGVLIIEPWLTPEKYDAGSPHMTIYDGKDIKIARLSISQRQGNISVTDMHWIIAEKGKKIEQFRDVHRMRLTPVVGLLSAMRMAGLRAKFIKSGIRGRIIGVRKLS